MEPYQNLWPQLLVWEQLQIRKSAVMSSICRSRARHAILVRWIEPGTPAALTVPTHLVSTISLPAPTPHFHYGYCGNLTTVGPLPTQNADDEDDHGRLIT
jgi:hypothetical protein